MAMPIKFEVELSYTQVIKDLKVITKATQRYMTVLQKLVVKSEKREKARKRASKRKIKPPRY